MMKFKEYWFCAALTVYLVVCLTLLAQLYPPLDNFDITTHTSNPRDHHVVRQDSVQPKDKKPLNLSTSSMRILDRLAVFHSNKTIVQVKRPPKAAKKSIIAPLTKSDFDIWSYKQTKLCGELMTSYNDVFFSFRDMFVNRTKANATMLGGEDPLKLLGVTKDEDEEYKYQQGVFLQPCPPEGGIGRVFNFNKNAAHTKEWMSKIVFTANATLLGDKSKAIVKDRITFAMMRYEFANVYWVLLDIYTAFLTARFFNVSLSDCDIVLFDAHPRTQLDPFYYNTTHHTRLLSETSPLTQYKHLVWPFTRVYSPLLNANKLSTPPYLLEFRSYILKQFRVQDNYQSPCGRDRKFNVLFPWRHDYVAHPRNPTGVVSRKISNEENILDAIRRNLSSNVTVQGVQLDSMSIQEQLHLVAHADIMIGMHGAAFSYTIFLPLKAAVVEIYPKGIPVNWHMGNLAQWKGHYYKRYTSPVAQDKNKATILSIHTVVTLVRDAMTNICNSDVAYPRKRS